MIKEKLKSGNKVIGTWNTLNSSAVTDIIASTGLDFIIIDFEHGPFSTENLLNLVNAAKANGVSPIVRIPENKEWLTLQALDLGAEGLICPHIKDLEESKKFTGATKYHPEGCRGFSPYTKAGAYTNIDSENYTLTANQNVFNVVIIECLEGLNNIESICKDSNLDCVYFGSYDLSQALGVPGNVHHPKVKEVIMSAAEKAKGFGKSVGGFIANNDVDIKWQKESLFDFIIYGVDSNLIQSQYLNAVTIFKGNEK